MKRGGLPSSLCRPSERGGPQEVESEGFTWWGFELEALSGQILHHLELGPICVFVF